jgi:hypothetical protein
MRHIGEVARFVRTRPERMVLIGAQADTEKPSEVQARACLEARCLWNTFLLVAKLSTLIRAGRKVLPDLSERMLRAARHSAAGAVSAVERECGFGPSADFSRTVLQGCPELLAVSPLPSGTWSVPGTH